MQYDETDDITYPYTGDDEGVWEPRVTNSGTYRIDGSTSSSNLSLAVQAPERKYSVESSLQFSRFLNKESSARYQAIVLTATSGGIDRAHFEVGLVHVKNADHRNGVVHALRVSPFHVDFIALDEAFFEYMHSHIYSGQMQLSVLEHEQKKKSQKTKNWGEGVSTLSIEEALTAQAVSEADFRNESEEWIDLTNVEEYEQNIRRNEAELTTQEFIRLILMEFLRSGSSDMHIEAGQPHGRIRFRYDSEMFVRWDSIPFIKLRQISMGMAEISGKDATQMKFKDIDSTVKVRAMRDGRAVEVELRFVSQPTLYSPSIVLRSQLKPIRDIHAVGFLPQQIEDLRAAYSQKRGILIVTGATGSGKTNTLESIYAQLEEKDGFKIIEVGEPIEIRSARRTQMSLRPNTPFTWWDAFYSCLRADPDIIGIGELRSAEHASVAINAALTGHLVLSTFHAANVEDTLSRMFQLGLPRENLSTGLNLILAQSLIKKLCERCKVIDPNPVEDYGGVPVYKAVGCPECFHKGTRGRTAMSELLYFNDDVKTWVEDRSMTARDVVNRAMEKGYLLTMRQVAREKVLAGVTSETEVAAVLGLVESKRLHSNAAFAAAAAASARPDPMARDTAEVEAIEGELVD
jgi:type II secretory ATPase GspE/PulE/Tfp pilus assembly ATPase PilB-like protein